MPMQVNICVQVNSKTIRREQHNGREHIVIPSYTLPFDVVMNGGLYPKDQIVANYQKLEGTLAPLGHPTVDGVFVSAFSPEGINQGHIGAWNRNVKLIGNRVYVEKWVDVEFAKNSSKGRRFLDRVNAIESGDGQPIHTSVAVFVKKIPAVNASGYTWVANINDMDHDAILLDEPGAATPENGVGLMVNADQAEPIQASQSALVGESYRERESRIQSAAKEHFSANSDDHVWLADFTDTQAVLVLNGGQCEIYGYANENGKINFGEAESPVVRRKSWASAVVNSVKRIINHQAVPDNNLEGTMPLTTEEKAELTNDISKAVAANMAEQLKPLAEKVSGLEANHKKLSDELTANSRAQEAEKRAAVAAKHGEVVANALSGDALDVMFKSLGSAAGLAGNSGHAGPVGLTADISNLPKE